MNHRLSRRRFIQSTSLAAGAFWVSGTQTWADELKSKSPNEKLNMAVIGCGGMGGAAVGKAKSQNFVAMCDVDEKRAAKPFEENPNVAKFADFRVMLDKRHKEIDAVFIATPDHVHAPAAVMAMRLGKHVYVQKPLSRDVREVRVMADVAKETKVATQMGNQGHSSRGTWQIIAAVRSGVIGKVHTVHTWCPKNYASKDRPKEGQPVPPTLNWDLWLGPAPERPFHHSYAPFNWRGFWDFGTGGLGDMACHIVSPAFAALELDYPTEVSSEGGPVAADMPEGFAIDQTVKWSFAGRGEGVHQQPVTLYWHQGKRIPRTHPIEGFTLPEDVKMKDEACIFVGEKGILYGDRSVGIIAVLPRDKFADFKVPDVGGRPGHEDDWMIACKGGRPACSNFDYSAKLTETVLLGNVAWKVGQAFKWDGAKGVSPDCPAVANWIQREYRKGWSL